jgi:YaiO family outer membrane protein
MKILTSIIGLILFFSCVYGQTTDDKKKTEVQINTSYEVLSKNLGSWKSVTLNFRHDFSPRQVVYGSYQKAYRASVADDSISVGLYQPLNKKFTLQLETNVSPNSKFSPKWSGLAQLETKIKPTFFINTGFRKTVYQQAKVNLINAGAEKYWGNYRLVYMAYIGKTKNSGATFSNRIQADRYYGESSSVIGADFSVGNEIDSIFNNGTVVKSRVTSIGFGGKHWLNQSFGINYRANFHQQGNFYHRGGVSVGANFRF